MLVENLVPMALSGLDPFTRHSLFLELETLNLPNVHWHESSSPMDLPTVLALDPEGLTLKALEQGRYQRVLSCVGLNSTCAKLQGYIPCFEKPGTLEFQHLIQSQVHRSLTWAEVKPR